MKVKIIKKTVHTGQHYGKLGQILDVPDAVARQWIALKAAEQVTDSGK